MKPITEIDDPRLVKGLAHPLRIHILRVLQDRVASPSEIADEIQAPLGNVSYHVRFLARVGLIELAGTEPRRGAVEHYYRAVGRTVISEKAWGQVPRVVKDALVSSSLDEIATTVAAAAKAGGFDRANVHTSCRTWRLDQQGFAELASEMDEVLKRTAEIERQSSVRLATSDHAAGEVDTTTVLLLFEGGRSAGPENADGDGGGDGAKPGRRRAVSRST